MVTLDASTLLYAGAAVATLYFAYKVVRLCFADADLHLLSKGAHKPDAFAGKVVWITGASQGLGEILAKYFAACGARLILSSRRRDKLEAVRDQCNVPASDVEILPFDLTGPYSKLEDAAAAADSAFSGAGVDYLVHNAGAGQHGLVEEISADVMDALFQINTTAPIKLTRAVLPHMLRRGKGRLVVVSSAAGKVPSPGQSVYAGCKGALQGYFSSLATELAGRGVSVTLCCPGPVAANPGVPRMVYGALGLQPVETKGESSSRISPERTAQLIATAAAHGVDEAWISKHPVLGLMYLAQLFPALAMAILKHVGPKRARAMKEGRSGYSVTGVLAGSSGSSGDRTK